MGKKLTIDEVRVCAKKLGKWVVLDDCYEGAHVKLKCQCVKCGYIHNISWREIRQGNGCCECNRRAKCLQIDYVKKNALVMGWIVLDNYYKNCKTLLNCLCIKGQHEHQLTWSDIQQGVGCVECNKVSMLEFIRAQFKKEGYLLLSLKYMNVLQKLDCVCPDGHKCSISWHNWKAGIRCPFHSIYRRKLTIDFIRIEFKKKGYKLLTTIYINARQKLDCICPNGHKWSVSWDSWGNKGVRCPCFSNRMKPKIEFIREEFKKKGYILLTVKYKNCYQKLEYICPRGHRHSISWINWKAGQGCPFCSKGIMSKFEKEIKDFVGILGVSFSSNSRRQLINPETNRRLELDIWMPQLNKAIECNGVYWHSKDRAIKNDKLKQRLCKEKDIELLVITDEKWNNDVENCKAKLVKFVGVGA